MLVLLFFNSCTKEVYTDDYGLWISSTNNDQKSNSEMGIGSEYSMLKLMLNYGTVTPYKKILSNWYVTEQSTSILIKEGC